MVPFYYMYTPTLRATVPSLNNNEIGMYCTACSQQMQSYRGTSLFPLIALFLERVNLLLIHVYSNNLICGAIEISNFSIV